MPSQVGDDPLTGGSKDQLSDECGSDDIDRQFPAAANSEFLQARESGLLGAAGEQHDHLTPAAPTSRSDYANTEAEAVGGAIATASGAEPTTNDGTSQTTVIARPRSSGEGLDKGFKFGKAAEPQLNMSRGSGPKAQPKENAGTCPVSKQGSISRSGKLTPNSYMALPYSHSITNSPPQQQIYGNSQQYKAPIHNDKQESSNTERPQLQIHTREGYKAADHPGSGHHVPWRDQNVSTKSRASASQPDIHKASNVVPEKSIARPSPVTHETEQARQQGDRLPAKQAISQAAPGGTPTQVQRSRRVRSLATPGQPGIAAGGTPMFHAGTLSLASSVAQTDSNAGQRPSKGSFHPTVPPNHVPHAKNGSSHRFQTVPPSSVSRENEKSAHNEIVIPTSAQQSLSAGKFPPFVVQPTNNGVAQDVSIEDKQEVPNVSRIISYSHDDFGGDGRVKKQATELDQRTPIMKQQVTRKVPASLYHQQRNEEHSSGINELSSMHEVSSRNGPAKVTKSASSSKSLKSTGKLSRASGSPAQRHNPMDSRPGIHSTQILAIWQKMFMNEQAEETAKERSKREVCEEEIEKLRCVEEQQKAKLDDAYEAKTRAINKLQHLKFTNKELNEKVQELTMSYATAASRLDDLKKDKGAFDEVWSKMEKKFEDLDADKKNLIASKDEQLQKALKELEVVREALRKARKDCEDASRVAETHEKQLNQKNDELHVSHDLVVSLKTSLGTFSSNYEIIKKILGDCDKSDVPSLKSISESIKKLSERQLPQGSIDRFLAATHAVQSLPALHNDVDLKRALDFITEKFRGKPDDVSVDRETLQHAANALEERLRSLLHAFQKELKSSTSTERNISDVRQKNAVLEERSATLQEKVDSLQQKLDTASSGESSARKILVGVQNELSNLKSTFPSVDSARLRELESSRAVADQELQSARSKLRGEEEKLRTLAETERELRQEFEQLKGRYKEAENSNSRLQMESSTESQSVSKQIEQERELAREYYARVSREICEQQRTKHVNELYERQQKFREAEGSLRFLSAEIVSLKDQIRRKDAEIQPAQSVQPEETSSETQELRQSLAVAKDQLKSHELKISALQKEKESQVLPGATEEQARTHAEQRARELQAALEKSSAESAEKLEKIQQQLNSLQNHKQKADSKYQQSQEMNRTIQEQLESANVQREKLHQQLQEAQEKLDEFDHDGEKQRRDVEEELRRREEQRVAEAEEEKRYLQEVYSRLEENEAIHQLKCKEYEDRLREFDQSRLPGTQAAFYQNKSLLPEAGGLSRVSTASSRGISTPALSTSAPAANSGTPRRPQKKVDRRTNSVVKAGPRAQPNTRNLQSQESGPHFVLQPEGKQILNNPQLGSHSLHLQGQVEDTADEHARPSQELGKQENLTESGVYLARSQKEASAEIPETIQESLSNPKLFSQFEEEHDASREDNTPSSLSIMEQSALDDLQKECENQLSTSTSSPQDHSYRSEHPAASSPTQRLSNESAARQMQLSLENPYFVNLPTSRANESRRMSSATPLRQSSHQTVPEAGGPDIPRTPSRPSQIDDDRAFSQNSSPAFIDNINNRNRIIYGGGRGTTESSHHFSTPAGIPKRRASGTFDMSSNKRTKSTASTAAGMLTRPSPPVTRASARGGPRSHVSETQSQVQNIKSTVESQVSSLKAESQSQLRSTKASQSQHRSLSQVPAVSRLRSSQGPSSSATGTSSPNNLRRRNRANEKSRFDAEIFGKL